MTKGKTIWILGLPSSGKTTLGRELFEDLKIWGWDVEHFDGDDLRTTICKNLGFTRKDRIENVRRVRYMCNLLNSHGIWVVVSFITPYQEMRDENRKFIEDYTEIWTNAPLEVCIKRDTKGIYNKGKDGSIEFVTGISDDFDNPKNSDVICYTDREGIDESVEKILRVVFKNRYKLSK